MSLSLVAALALMQTAAPAPESDIVVRGKRTAAALSACIERECPTTDDVRLSIAHAEARFAEGKYHEARSVLDKAISRTRRSTSRFPRYVAALHDAYATIALHRGDMEDYQQAVGRNARILRRNLPADDPDVQALRIRIGDAWLKRGNLAEAERQYQSAEDRFHESGAYKLAAMAALRRVAVKNAMGLPSEAQDIQDRVNASEAATDPAIRNMLAAVTAQKLVAAGGDIEPDAALTTLSTDPAAPPIMLREAFSPISADMLSPAEADPFSAIQRGSVITPVQWVDIGFYVSPKGNVTDAEVLRGSGTNEWAPLMVKRVTSRRYAPIALPPRSPGLYRIERFTLRADRRVAVGSRIKTPSGEVNVEVTDMTAIETANNPN